MASRMAPRLPSSCVKLSLASSPHRAASSAVSAGSFFRRRANRPPPFFYGARALRPRGSWPRWWRRRRGTGRPPRRTARSGAPGRAPAPPGRAFPQAFRPRLPRPAGLLAHVRGQRVLHGELRRIVNGVRGLAPGLLHPAHALSLCGAQLFSRARPARAGASQGGPAPACAGARPLFFLSSITAYDFAVGSSTVVGSFSCSGSACCAVSGAGGCVGPSAGSSSCGAPACRGTACTPCCAACAGAAAGAAAGACSGTGLGRRMGSGITRALSLAQPHAF